MFILIFIFFFNYERGRRFAPLPFLVATRPGTPPLCVFFFSPFTSGVHGVFTSVAVIHICLSENASVLSCLALKCEQVLVFVLAFAFLKLLVLL